MNHRGQSIRGVRKHVWREFIDGIHHEDWGTDCQHVSLVWKSPVTVVAQEGLKRKLQRHSDNGLGRGGRREQKRMAQGQLGSPDALLGASVVS